MKKSVRIIVGLFLIGCASGCVRFKTPTQELEIDATPLIKTNTVSNAAG